MYDITHKKTSKNCKNEMHVYYKMHITENAHVCKHTYKQVKCSEIKGNMLLLLLMC